MTTVFAIQVMLAVVAVLFVSYGLLHEDKFVAFEDMVIRTLKKKIYFHKRRKALEKRRQQGSCANNAQRVRREDYPYRQDTVERRRVA